MPDAQPPTQCLYKCPVDERERDAIWARIEDLKLMVTTLDKSQAVQQAELARVSARVESVHDHFIEKLDAINTSLAQVAKKVHSDSDELRRREGKDLANKRWATWIIGVLGLIFAAGGYVAFQPAVASHLLKDPAPPRIQTIERTIE
jgi:hypothetical protein